MMGAIIIFGEKSFIFSFVGLATWSWVSHLRRGPEKVKCQKMNVFGAMASG
jgi:hypothetical protein